MIYQNNTYLLLKLGLSLLSFLIFINYEWLYLSKCIIFFAFQVCGPCLMCFAISKLKYEIVNYILVNRPIILVYLTDGLARLNLVKIN